MGMSAHEAIELWENATSDSGEVDLNSLSLILEWYTDGIIFNHRDNSVYYFYVGDKELARFIKRVVRGPKSFQTVKKNSLL